MPDPLQLQKASRTVGNVDAVDDDSIVIAAPNGQQQRPFVTNDTRMSRASVGLRKDVHTGARVIVRKHPDRVGEATEVIVLPDDTTFCT
jgi:hypothetical protein